MFTGEKTRWQFEQIIFSPRLVGCVVENEFLKFAVECQVAIEIWPDQWLFSNEMYSYFKKILEIAKKNYPNNEEFKPFKFVTGDKVKLGNEYLKKTRESFDWLEDQKKKLYSNFEKILPIPNN